MFRFKLFLPGEFFCFVLNQPTKAATNCCAAPPGKMLTAGPGGAVTGRKTIPSEELPLPLRRLLSPLKDTENSFADSKLGMSIGVKWETLFLLHRAKGKLSFLAMPRH